MPTSISSVFVFVHTTCIFDLDNRFRVYLIRFDDTMYGTIYRHQTVEASLITVQSRSGVQSFTRQPETRQVLRRTSLWSSDLISPVQAPFSPKYCARTSNSNFSEQLHELHSNSTVFSMNFCYEFAQSR